MAQQEFAQLEEVAVTACREVEGLESQSGSSTVRLRALGSHVTSRLKDTLMLGVRKTLGVVTTHY